MSVIEVKLHQMMDALDSMVYIQKKTVQHINELERNGNSGHSECSFSQSSSPGRQGFAIGKPCWEGAAMLVFWTVMIEMKI